MASMTISVDENVELESDIEISRREFAEGKGIPLETVSRNALTLLREHATGRMAR